MNRNCVSFHITVLRVDHNLIEWCNPWLHVASRHISISQLLSLWRHSHYDFSCPRCLQPPFSLWRRSHCDVICYWAGHAHRYGLTDTLPRLIYEDGNVVEMTPFGIWEVISITAQNSKGQNKPSEYRRTETAELVTKSHQMLLLLQHFQTKQWTLNWQFLPHDGCARCLVEACTGCLLQRIVHGHDCFLLETENVFNCSRHQTTLSDCCF